MRLTSILIAPLALAIGCGGKSSAPEQPAATPAPPPENPGGMWMPKQLTSRAKELRALGLEIAPESLANPLTPPLAAVVSLGGCTASFVSPDGLVITNHHCIQGALQYHSTPQANLVETGYLAKTRAEEKWNGPTSWIYVTQRITDVTDKVRADIDSIASDRERYQVMDTREKELVRGCEEGRPEVQCSVRAFFGGAEYYLIEQLVIRDVRLVYAPHRAIGSFGGDEDNWMWPRHAGDFAFYRAYVGPDGKPADFSDKNVPYKPAHHLTVTSTPLKAGDFVMVAGYPGWTGRHRTAEEAKDTVEWEYPRSIASAEELLTVLREVSKTSPETAIKASPLIMGTENRLKKTHGIMGALVGEKLVDRKVALQAELKAWMNSDAARQKEYGDLFEKMAALTTEYHKTRARDKDLDDVLSRSSMLRAALTIVQMAEERPKPDAEREEGFQERDMKKLTGMAMSMDRRYDRNLDKAVLKLMLTRAARDLDQNRDWLTKIVGNTADAAAIDKAVEQLYAKPALEDAKVRMNLLTTATTAKLKAHTDPFIRLALVLRPLEHELNEREKSFVGAMSLLKPRYTAALRAFRGDIAPDANGTLRITYGTVRGYRPKPDAAMYEPFTKLSQVVAKDRGAAPFDVPKPLLQAFEAKRFGSYVDAKLGEVPVDFLTDLDITGGNSGSPTLNSRGELTGVVFDTVYEGVVADWLFLPERHRSIHVDIRYVLWIMDAVDGAHHLMREMGVTPSFAEAAPLARGN